jgi:hypothetical protein
MLSGWYKRDLASTATSQWREVPVTILREHVVADLRREGYTFREIAQLLGISRQRADQIEKRIARSESLTKSSTKRPRRSHAKDVACKRPRRVRVITPEEFAHRLLEINSYYEERIDLILSGGSKAKNPAEHQEIKSRANGASEKLRRFIRHYDGEPFHLAQLVSDFPELADESYLSQKLCQLRRRGVLRKLGSIRVEGQIVPESLLAEAPGENYATKAIEVVAQRWSKKLLDLAKHYRPTRPATTFHQVRRHFVQKLLESGCSKTDADAVFPPRESARRPHDWTGKGGCG